MQAASKLQPPSPFILHICVIMYKRVVNFFVYVEINCICLITLQAEMYEFSMSEACPSVTPFLWPFTVVSPLTVFGTNSKLSSIPQLSGLLNAPPTQHLRFGRSLADIVCFTNLLTYLLMRFVW